LTDEPQPQTYVADAQPNNGQTIQTDPIDVEGLWESPPTPVEFKPIIAGLSVRKPKRDEYFRVRDDLRYTVDAKCLEAKPPGQLTPVWYWVPRQLWTMPPLAAELKVVRLHTVMTTTGVKLLWPIKLDTGGSGSEWRDSALEIAERAKAAWLRTWGDMAAGRYAAEEAAGDHGEPDWPTEPFTELVRLAFKGRVIDSLAHEVVRKLTGEI
jgi:hypothetical protein